MVAPEKRAVERSSKQARVAAGEAAIQGPGGPYKRICRTEQKLVARSEAWVMGKVVVLQTV